LPTARDANGDAGATASAGLRRTGFIVEVRMASRRRRRRGVAAELSASTAGASGCRRRIWRGQAPATPTSLPRRPSPAACRGRDADPSSATPGVVSRRLWSGGALRTARRRGSGGSWREAKKGRAGRVQSSRRSRPGSFAPLGKPAACDDRLIHNQHGKSCTGKDQDEQRSQPRKGSAGWPRVEE
jgi:hypothetical protein